MKKHVRSGVFVGAVFLLAAGLAVGYEYIERGSPLPVYGPQTGSGAAASDHVIPRFTSVSQDGGTFSSEILNGRITVVNFFFTSCPSVCPRMMRNLQSVFELYRNDPQVMFVSLTVDPKRDDPARLKRYAESLNADTGQWRFLTGEKKEIYRLARNAFFISAADGDGGDLDFIHSENLILLDRTGRIRGYYNGLDETAMDDLSRDIVKLKKERS